MQEKQLPTLIFPIQHVCGEAIDGFIVKLKLKNNKLEAEIRHKTDSRLTSKEKITASIISNVHEKPPRRKKSRCPMNWTVKR